MNERPIGKTGKVGGGLLAVTSMLVALFLLGSTGFFLQPAYAHAYPVSSVPPNGGQVRSLPSEVKITYTEGVAHGDFSVINSKGERVDIGNAMADPKNPAGIIIPLRQLPPGASEEGSVYTVKWKVLSVDTHTTEGSFFFVVGNAFPTREQILSSVQGAGSPEAAEAFSPYEPPIRWFLFLSTAVLVGSPITLLVVVNPVLKNSGGTITSFDNDEGSGKKDRNRHKGRVRLLLLSAAITLVVFATLLAVKQITSVYSNSKSLADELWSFITTTVLGNIWLVRVILSAGLIAVLLTIRRRPNVWNAASIAVGAATILSFSVTSHTASYIHDSLAIASDATHAAGAAVWAGGVVVLAVLLPPMLFKKTRQKKVDGASNPSVLLPMPSLLSRIIMRFSPIAIVGVTLAGANGLLMTSWHVPDWGALFSTLYGVSLLVKVALVVAAVAFGGVNRIVLLRRLSRDRDPLPFSNHAKTFTRSIRLELAMLVAVFFFSGLLTSAPTAVNTTELQAQSSSATTTAAGPLVLKGQFDNGMPVTLRVTPGSVGLNVFDVVITNQSGGPVQDIKNVRLLLHMTKQDLELPQMNLEPVQSQEGGSNGSLYSTVGAISTSGEWSARVAALVEGKFLTKTFEFSLSSSAESMNNMQGMNGMKEMNNMNNHVYGSNNNKTFEDTLRIAAVFMGVAAAGILVYEGYKVKLKGVQKRI